ncbi:unannotated protein [freshwater metagenome]|uniref:Unannotated protein n=1 Tax=freshwater metagenome TaxID=449393 RepID=A0A6J7H601_9ZZZZ
MQRQLRSRGDHGDTGRVQSATQRRDGARDRPHDDRHLGPGHSVDQVRASHGVGDDRGFLGRRRHDVYPGFRLAEPSRGHRLGTAVPTEPGQSPRHDVGQFRHCRHRSKVPRQDHPSRRVRIEQIGHERGIRSTEREDGLIGVPGDHGRFGIGADQPNQLRSLRIEVLCIVDDEVPDAGALTAQQIRVGGERHQCAADELGRVEARCRGPCGFDADCAAQQHGLFVSSRELADGDPFGSAVRAAELDQILGPDSAFGGSEHHVSHRGDESCGTESRAQSIRPVGCSVLDVAPQHLADHRVLLGTGQQSRRRIAVEGGLQPEYRERIRVHRAYQRFARGAQRVIAAEQTGGDLLAERDGRALRLSEHQDRFRIAGHDSGDCVVRHERCLSRAGPAEHLPGVPSRSALSRLRRRIGSPRQQPGSGIGPPAGRLRHPGCTDEGDRRAVSAVRAHAGHAITNHRHTQLRHDKNAF